MKLFDLKCMPVFLSILTCLYAGNPIARTRQGRVTGGTVSRPHSRPFMVSLQTRFLWARYRHCAGALVNHYWVLSAGHCVTDNWASWLPMDAIIGAHDLEKISSNQIVPVSRRVVHPNYRGGVGPYDIAMLKLSKKVIYTPRVYPILLPNENQRLYRDNRLHILGWGYTKETYFYAELPNKLHEVEVAYLPFSDCYKAVNRFVNVFEYNPLSSPSNICSGPISGGVAACMGDSGGPLVQFIPLDEVPGLPEEPTLPSETEETEGTGESESSTEPTDTSETGEIAETVEIDEPTMPSATIVEEAATMPQELEETTTETGETEDTMITGTEDMITPSSPRPVPTDRPSTGSIEVEEATRPENLEETMTTGTEDMMTPSSPRPVPTDRPSTGSIEVEEATMPENLEETMTTETEEMLETTLPTIEIPSSPRPVPTDRPTDSRKPMIRNFKASGRETPSLSEYPVTDDGIPVAVGVISWGISPCGFKGAPTVYTNVTQFLGFIHKYMNE